MYFEDSISEQSVITGCRTVVWQSVFVAVDFFIGKRYDILAFLQMKGITV